MTNTHNKWFKWLSTLFVVAICLATPATGIAAEPETVAQDTGSYIPFVRNNVCNGTRSTDNKVGVQLYGPTGYQEAHFTLLQNSQTHWIRNSVPWRLIEPTDRTPNLNRWERSDRIVRAANHNCANLVITITGTPDWARTIEGHDSAPFKPEYTDDFIEFVTAMVERYDGDGIKDAPSGAVVNYWELYNEPDLGDAGVDSGWGEHGARYAEMLKAVYGPIKTANPNAQVVFGGIAYNLFTDQNGHFVREFLDNVLDAGGEERYFDFMNFHHYPFPNNRANWTESKSSGLWDKLKVVKQKLEAHGQGAIPIMVTEVGWNSDQNDLYPSTPEYQGRHVVQMMAQAIAARSPLVVWWSFIDYSGGFPYKTGLITISDDSATAKPTYTVYNEAVKRLGPAEPVGVVREATAENDLEVYQFTDPASKKTFYVAWVNPIAPFSADFVATFDDNKTMEYLAPGSRATIFSKEGTLLLTKNDGDDGIVNGLVPVTVGTSPIYIVVE